MSASLNLAQALDAQRGELAMQAQRVYDAWVEDGRGLCGSIACSFAELLTDVLDSDAEVFVLDIEGPEDDPPHTLCLVENDVECFSVDLPYALYEEGRRKGQRWTWSRKPGAVFSAHDLVIVPA